MYDAKGNEGKSGERASQCSLPSAPGRSGREFSLALHSALVPESESRLMHLSAAIVIPP